jgi:phytoene dehydrogenase-like protein
MEGKVDCLILGSGVGSLICGTLLAQCGWRVLMLTESPPEQTLTFSWNGWRLDRRPEFLWGLEEGGVLHRIFASLDWQPEVIRVDPAVQVLLPGHRIGFYSPGPEWERELRREFPQSLKPISACLQQLSQIHRVTRSQMEAHLTGRRSWRPSPMIARQPLKRFLSRFDLDPLFCHMVEILTAACFAMEPETSTAAMAASLFDHIHHGLFALRGGIARLADQRSSRCRALGGELRIGRFQDIPTGWGRIQGVKTVEGEEISCRHFVVEPGPTSMNRSLCLLVDEVLIPGEMRRNVLVFEPCSDGAGFRAILQLALEDGEGFLQASEGEWVVMVRLFHAPPEDPRFFLERFFPGWSSAEMTLASPLPSPKVPYSPAGRWLRPVNLTILSHHCPLGTGVAASALQGYRAALRLSSRAFIAG